MLATPALLAGGYDDQMANRKPWRNLSALFFLFILLVAAVARADASEQPLHFDAVKAAYRSSETWLLDHAGEPVQRIRTDFSVRRGQWLELRNMSPALLHAIVLSEDRNFYEHSGVDWSAVSAAAWANLWNERTRGASTITMQLAGLLNEPLQPQHGRRTWRQKINQALLARTLEKSWSKAQILEAYLNLVPFRGELVGLDALALALFGKQAHALDARESAIAAALVRAPNADTALVAQRACAALQLAQSPWGGDCKALEFFVSAALRRRNFAVLDGVAPHFARYALQQARQAQPDGAALPQQVRSTLDGPLQRFAGDTLRMHLREISAQNVQDGAVLVLDNASGAVLAWVGSSGRQLSQAAEVDAVLALRQPGSTLKPFLYAQALAEKRLTAASLLDDSPAGISTAHGLYVPQNYDSGFKGWVSVRQALAASLNIPAVRALVMVSPDAFAEQLKKLELPLPEPAGYYGYSLALGGVDVSLLRLTNAYRTLANGGLQGPVRALADTEAAQDQGPAVRVLDEGAAFIIGDILADRHARAATFGTDSHLATRFWSAVKTGTSKDMRDNWAIGYTRHFTIGVWVGNADGSPMRDVSGVSGAAPVWAAIAARLHAMRPGAAPAAPPVLARQQVDYAAGTGMRLEAGRAEWFLPGTQQDRFRLARVAQPLPQDGAARITQPLDGTVVALDPDIPPGNQLLRLASSRADVAWHINGQPARDLQAHGGQWFWPPRPGGFRIELRDAASGGLLDAVRIEVRGAFANPLPQPDAGE